MLLNSIVLVGIILCFNITKFTLEVEPSLHVSATKRQEEIVTTFHGTYNFSGKIKNFIILCKIDLIIAGSNFIFSYIKENYSEY